MKKIFTLSVGVCLAISVFAQKDVEIKLLSPKTGDEIYVKETIQLTYSIKNVGIDVLTAADSVFVNMKMSGDYVFGGFSHRHVPHNTMAVGDSVFYTFNFAFTEKEIDDFPFCFELETSSNGQPFDSQSGNNESCAMINVDERSAASVENAQNNGVKLYPNPAASSITIENLKSNALQKAVITDMLGAVKMEVDLTDATQQLSIEGFTDGIYFCRLFDNLNNTISTIKFSVAK